VLALLDDPVCRDALLAHVAAERALLADYLAESGVRDGPEPVGLVDIGWRGTIQDNLARLLPHRPLHGYYLGLQGFLNPQAPNIVKRAYGPDLNRGPDHAELFRRLPLIELLCTPAVGSPIGYRRAGYRGVEVLRTDDEDHDSIPWQQAIAPFQAGVRHALPVWAEALGIHAVDSSELRAAALGCWRRIIERPPTVIEQASVALKHDERFGRGLHAVPPPRRRSLLGNWLGGRR